MILAGDIGGTHTRLALYENQNGTLRVNTQLIYQSAEHKSLDEVVAAFMHDHLQVESACFAVAGPVKAQRSVISNTGWAVDALALVTLLKAKTVYLINDVEAIAYGISALTAADLVVVNEGVAVTGNRAVIAAGTGLGEAGLHWEGKTHRALASEAGHADFAARGDLQIDLLRFLSAKFGRVSYERVLSGPGLVNVYEFLRQMRKEPEPKWLAEELKVSDPAVVISQAALSGRSGLCERALDLFMEVYAAEAGNCALRFSAFNGLFIAGGIAMKVLPKFQEPAFLKTFTNKGRMAEVLRSIPVSIVKNESIGLLGAAQYLSADGH